MTGKRRWLYKKIIIKNKATKNTNNSKTKSHFLTPKNGDNQKMIENSKWGGWDGSEQLYILKICDTKIIKQ